MDELDAVWRLVDQLRERNAHIDPEVEAVRQEMYARLVAERQRA